MFEDASCNQILQSKTSCVCHNLLNYHKCVVQIYEICRKNRIFAQLLPLVIDKVASLVEEFIRFYKKRTLFKIIRSW